MHGGGWVATGSLKIYMKKLLGIAVIVFLFSGEAYSKSIHKDSLKGLKEFKLELSVTELCGVTKNSLETSIKYILSNSNIKLVDNSASLLALHVQIMVEEDIGCFGHADLSVLEWWETTNSANYKIAVPYVLYKEGRYRKGPPNSFNINLVNTVEELTKNFVIEWSNKN